MLNKTNLIKKIVEKSWQNNFYVKTEVGTIFNFDLEMGIKNKIEKKKYKKIDTNITIIQQKPKKKIFEIFIGLKES